MRHRPNSNQQVAWSSPSSPLRLDHNEVHIWRAFLHLSSKELGSFNTLLAEEERSRAARFILERDQAHYTAAHGILRTLIGAYLKRAPASLRFMQGPQGKPTVVRADSDPPILFNLSHSHDIAVFAVAHNREVGIDTEFMRPYLAGPRIAERYFSPREVSELNSLREEQRIEGFFLCWTRKEAYVKARGLGLQIPLSSFDVSLIPGTAATLRSDDESRWDIEAFSPHAGYVGAVVAEGKDWSARYFEWASEHPALPV